MYYSGSLLKGDVIKAELDLMCKWRGQTGSNKMSKYLKKKN